MRQNVLEPVSAGTCERKKPKATRSNVVGRRQRERVEHLVTHGRPLPHPGASRGEHLGRRIGDEQVVGDVGEEGRPRRRARRELENPSRRGEGARSAARIASVVGRERIALGHGRGVVLGGPSAVVGDLLIEQLAVGHRRSDGTPRVTAAATVAVARASGLARTQ